MSLVENIFTFLFHRNTTVFSNMKGTFKFLRIRRINAVTEEIPDGSNVSGEPFADVSAFSLFSPNSFLYIDSIYEIR